MLLFGSKVKKQSTDGKRIKKYLHYGVLVTFFAAIPFLAVYSNNIVRTSISVVLKPLMWMIAAAWFLYTLFAFLLKSYIR